MPEQTGRSTIIIKQKNAPDLLVELAEYLEILGSPVRLAILKMLELKPMDIETISHVLFTKYDKTSSRENTKNHVDKLLSVGLVTKQAGMRENRAVVNYVLVPGSIEAAMRTLSKVIKLDLSLELKIQAEGIRAKFGEELVRDFPTVRVLGGSDDGRVFELRKNIVGIGRVDIEHQEEYDSQNDIVLSDSYGAVTRVSKKHAVLILENNQWFVEHCEGVNETHLWDKKLVKHRKEKLSDGDMITLAEGDKSVRLVFQFQKSRNAP